MMRLLFFVVLSAILVTGVAGKADAHSKSLSFSDWLWQGAHLKLSFSVPQRDVTLLPSVSARGLAPALATHLNNAITITQGEMICTRQASFTAHPAHSGYLTMRAQFICPSATDDIRISNHAFFNHAPSHVHFAHFRTSADTKRGEEILFTATARSFTLSHKGDSITAANRAVLSTYLYLGITHIISGIDHIAFLLCLLLLATNMRQTIFLITGFTFGHSVTLALAALEIALPNSAVVEAIIGFTIALVAAESILARQHLMKKAGGVVALALLILAIIGGNLPPQAWAGLIIFTLCYGFLIRTTDDTHRFAPLMTLLFGAVHGFGFGGVLHDIGLPPAQIIQALFGFNIGVEIGQIAIIATIFISRAILSRLLSGRVLAKFSGGITTPIAIKDIAACFLTAYGVFLFIQRSLF